MKGALDNFLVGVIVSAGIMVWIGSGYLIQRYLFRNRSPDGTTIIATAMGGAIVAFIAAAMLAKVLGYA